MPFDPGGRGEPLFFMPLAVLEPGPVDVRAPVANRVPRGEQRCLIEGDNGRVVTIRIAAGDTLDIAVPARLDPCGTDGAPVSGVRLPDDPRAIIRHSDRR